MFTMQSSLGDLQGYRPYRFDYIIFAKVTSNADYDTKGRVEVKLFNGRTFGGVPVPVTVLQNGVNFAPKEGDLALLGYANGIKNAPVILGFINGKYSNTNTITIEDGTVLINGRDIIDEISSLEYTIQSLSARVQALESR
jgi:hypothetical protein